MSAEKPLLGQPLFTNDYESLKNAYKKSKKRTVISKISNIELEKQDFGTLLGKDEWLNDKIIDAWGSILNAEYEHVLVFNVFFNDSMRLADGEQRRQKYFKVRKEEKDKYFPDAHIKMMLFPLNVGGNHWILYSYNVDKNEVRRLNSLCSGKSKTKIPRKWKILLNYAIPRIKKVFGIPYTKNNKYPKYQETSTTIMPQQNNQNDCGMFVCAYMECLAAFGKIKNNCLPFPKKQWKDNMVNLRWKLGDILHKWRKYQQ